MKINKLNDNFFFNFASEILGVDVLTYGSDIEIKRNENNVKLMVLWGGEMEDERKFIFKDDKCIFKNLAYHADSARDISYEWVQYILDNAEGLTNEEIREIVDDYNENIENEIKDYTVRRREALIV